MTIPVKKIGFLFASLSMIVMPFSQLYSFAMEGGTEAYGSVILPVIREEIISVDFPTVEDESPFDFYIDPKGLLYKTGAVRHGGGVVEGGAFLLFQNHDDGEYDFSRYSDRLNVVNRSTIPVNVKITAEITDLGDLRMDQDGVFDGEEDCAIYLAIVDDEGNEQVLSEDGEVSVEIEMTQAPAYAYTYHYDEATDSYEYVYQADEDIQFDTYSFGLHGESNENADWREFSASPRVMVTWSVEPVYPEGEDAYEPEGEGVEEPEDTKDPFPEVVFPDELSPGKDAKSMEDEGGEDPEDEEGGIEEIRDEDQGTMDRAFHSNARYENDGND